MASDIELTASSIAALSQDFHAVAHNLANVSTTGYKRLRSRFSNELEVVLRGLEEAAGTVPAEVQGEITIDFSQGSLTHTGRPLDLALEGKGFFVIETPQGPLYTRNGIFHISPNGQVADFQGRIIAGQAGPITIPDTVSPLKIHVAGDGSVSAGGRAIGRLKLVEFDDVSVLESVGGTCFRPTTAVPPKDAVATIIHQGYQEASNVPAVRELVRLITISRLYEANIKSAQTLDDQMKYLLQVAMSS